ncbi:thioredoxin family protein [Dermabacteraceae bacterium TAE3-ERU27]|nr:thioredoxin family protein [Dermabacteraceae bacterium TAE3-ERU27]
MSIKRNAAAVVLAATCALGLAACGSDAETKPATATNSQQTQQGNSAAAGKYVDYDEYAKDPAAYANTKTVLYFSADWCPQCQYTDKELKENPSFVPEDVTLVKVDFDSSTQLRQKYGVTMQHTFVQIDADGNAVKTWQGAGAAGLAGEVQR